MVDKMHKEFDCVKMKDDAQKVVAKTVKAMTREERIAYFNKKAADAKKRKTSTQGKT